MRMTSSGRETVSRLVAYSVRLAACASYHSALWTWLFSKQIVRRCARVGKKRRWSRKTVPSAQYCNRTYCPIYQWWPFSWESAPRSDMIKFSMHLSWRRRWLKPHTIVLSYVFGRKRINSTHIYALGLFASHLGYNLANLWQSETFSVVISRYQFKNRFLCW